MKALATATGSTVNDVLMTVIDHALHNYLEEHSATIKKPLVALMAMSVRSTTKLGSWLTAALSCWPLPPTLKTQARSKNDWELKNETAVQS